MKPSSIQKAASRSPRGSRSSDIGALAALLQQELSQRGTRWPAGALSFDEVRAERRRAKLPYGSKQTQRFLRDARNAGKVEMLRGYEYRGTHPVPAVKYFFK